jgi:ABC-type proline/glycine betaine transport system substrate-binding protein
LKKLIMLAAIGAALSLGACATASDPNAPAVTTTIPANVQAVITEVQTDVKTACGYSVDVSTIANVLSAIGVPYVGMVSEIVSQVCGAVNKLGSRRGASGPPKLVVNGRTIVIHGHRGG